MASRNIHDHTDECIKWMKHGLHILQERALVGTHVPRHLQEKLRDFDVNALNTIGETLMMSVLRYIDDTSQRQKYLRLLIDNKADVNVQDRKEKRTALMHACVMESRTPEGTIIMNAVSNGNEN
ncbi:hypothetical protein AB6A40_009801 [Gnathostoma spinigerum]|uniref:Uncharacterized protein n=1 Tax=Gnathostoma spinigerum TaxID=75299 RepID=A0ABD6F1I0_9BILA